MGDRPQQLDGTSLYDVLVNGAKLPSDAQAVSQFHGADLAMSWYLIRTNVSDSSSHLTDARKDWKLIVYGTGKEVSPQLFNITNDPEELNDVHEQFPEIVQSLTARLAQVVDFPTVSLDVAQYNIVKLITQVYAELDRTWVSGGSTAQGRIGSLS